MLYKSCRVFLSYCQSRAFAQNQKLARRFLSDNVDARPAASGCPNFFITTPIFYVNAAPHIGHLYTCVIADAAARHRRLQGDNIIFSTGTDEHGLKIQQAAAKHKMLPAQFTTEISQTFKSMFDDFGISYTDFIRTTEERHRKTVEHIWKELETNGYIYKGEYEGWYSVSDEAFIGEDEVTDAVGEHGKPIKVSITSGQQVTWMKEDNYMFALTKFRDQLHAWLDKGVIQPELFETGVRRWVDTLQDLSVSRSHSRLSWGIPVPGDHTQTIYVWLDALVNYLTVSGYPNTDTVWPPDCQIVGKDIIKFHAVYWPAFLMACDLEPPRKIFCHSHWLIDNVKMSKSRGNVVDPIEVKEKYSAEVFRYYLLREGVPHNDGNYNEATGMEYVNSDLVNNLGNLLSRCTASTLNPEQIYPRKCDEVYQTKFNGSERETFENLEMLIDTIEKDYNELHFYRGIESIMSYLRWANSLVQFHEPWKLAKSDDETDIAHKKTVIHIALETLRVSGIALQPIIPDMSERLLNRLGIPTHKRTFKNAQKPYLNSPGPYSLGPNEGILIKKLKIEKTQEKLPVRAKSKEKRAAKSSN